MGRVTRFLSILSLLIVFSGSSPRLEVPEGQIPNWSAPQFWSPPSTHARDQARAKQVNATSAPLPFIAIAPCRQYDSRSVSPLPDNANLSVTLTGAPCGIPSSAQAISANITVVDIIGAGGNGVFRVGTANDPTTAWINYPPTETQRANAGVVPLNDLGQIVVKVNQGGGSIDFIVDVNGYYDGSGMLQLSQSRRAILDQFWTPQNSMAVGLTPVGGFPELVRSDGADLWVANFTDNSVSRVRASDGRLLETWTGATKAFGVLVAMGRVFVTGGTSPGSLYRMDPTQTAGAVTNAASNLGNQPAAIAFDGARIWTANFGGSVSIVTPGASLPWTVTTVSTGFSEPLGILYDGANVWVTDFGAGTLLKLDSSGSILQTVTVGAGPSFPIFDGINIWVPNENSNSVSVVRGSDGAVVRTLSGNGLDLPISAAFDGQRILVTNFASTVSLWRAADLTALGSFKVGAGNTTEPIGACSDGLNFWITLHGADALARF